MEFTPIWELSKDTLEKLSKLKTISDVKQVGEYWYDDHIECFNITFTSKSENYKMSLWWTGPELIGTVKYSKDSKTAKKDLIEYIIEKAKHALEELEES